MPEPIKISFMTVGENEAARAFDTVEKRVRKLQETENRLTRSRQTSRRVGAAVDTKSEEAAASRLNKIRERSALMAGKIAEQQARKEIREAERAAKEIARIQKREAQKTANEVASIKKRSDKQMSLVAGAGARGVRAGIGSLANIGAGLVATGGGAMIGNAVISNLQLRRQAALLVNSSREMDTGNSTQSVTGLVSTAQGVAGKYGFGANEVMQSMANVSARGGGAPSLKAYKEDLDDIAASAKAFGVTMEDTGSVYAAMMNAGVKPGKEARDLFTDLIAQGKMGAIEMADLAGEAAKLSGKAGMTNISARDRVAQSVAFAQIAARAQVSPEESRTALSDVIRDMYTGGSKFESAGTKVFDQSGMVGNLADILPTIIDTANTKGYGGQKGLKSILGRGKFSGTSTAIITELNKLYMGAGGGEAGKKRVQKEIATFSGAHLAGGERDKALAEVMGTDLEKTNVALEQFKTKIGELTPKIAELLPGMLNVTKAFANFAVWAGQNPWQGAGVVLSASIAKEVANAGLDAALKTGVGKAFGSIGTIAMVATAVYLTGQMIIDKSFEENDKRIFDTASAGNSQDRARQMLARGSKVNPESALELAGQLDVQSAEASKRAGAGTSVLKQMFGGLAAGYGAVTGNKDIQETVQQDVKREARTQVENEATAASAKELADALRAAAAAAKEVNPGRGGPNRSGAPAATSPSARSGIQ